MGSAPYPERVIRAAIRRRDRRSSGKSLLAAALALLVLLALGLVLIFVVRAGELGLVVVLFTVFGAVPVLNSVRPGHPWGRALAVSCPRCGRQTLREGHASAWWNRALVGGIVTLCTPECGHREIRRPGTERI